MSLPEGTSIFDGSGWGDKLQSSSIGLGHSKNLRMFGFQVTLGVMLGYSKKEWFIVETAMMIVGKWMQLALALVIQDTYDLVQMVSSENHRKIMIFTNEFQLPWIGCNSICFFPTDPKSIIHWISNVWWVNHGESIFFMVKTQVLMVFIRSKPQLLRLPAVSLWGPTVGQVRTWVEPQKMPQSFFQDATVASQMMFN